MFRVVLAIYFLATTLAGPSLCFCKVARLAIAAIQLVSPTATDAEIHPCCCKTVIPAEHSSTIANSGTKSNRSPEQCPCQKHVAKNQCFPAADVRGLFEVSSLAFAMPSLDTVSWDAPTVLTSHRAPDSGAHCFICQCRLAAFQIALC
jgi:hypothetical protein